MPMRRMRLGYRAFSKRDYPKLPGTDVKDNNNSSNAADSLGYEKTR